MKCLNIIYLFYFNQKIRDLMHSIFNLVNINLVNLFNSHNFIQVTLDNFIVSVLAPHVVQNNNIPIFMDCEISWILVLVKIFLFCDEALIVCFVCNPSIVKEASQLVICIVILPLSNHGVNKQHTLTAFSHITQDTTSDLCCSFFLGLLLGNNAFFNLSLNICDLNVLIISQRLIICATHVSNKDMVFANMISPDILHFCQFNSLEGRNLSSLIFFASCCFHVI